MIALRTVADLHAATADPLLLWAAQGLRPGEQAWSSGAAVAVVVTALAALVHDYGSAALMVDGDNVTARALYDSLGLSYRDLRAAVPS